MPVFYQQKALNIKLSLLLPLFVARQGNFAVKF